jgi:hypothetical protein
MLAAAGAGDAGGGDVPALAPGAVDAGDAGAPAVFACVTAGCEEGNILWKILLSMPISCLYKKFIHVVSPQFALAVAEAFCGAADAPMKAV